MNHADAPDGGPPPIYFASSKPPTTTKTSMNFFSLPRELRQQIILLTYEWADLGRKSIFAERKCLYRPFDARFNELNRNLKWAQALEGVDSRIVADVDYTCNKIHNKSRKWCDEVQEEEVKEYVKELKEERLQLQK